MTMAMATPSFSSFYCSSCCNRTEPAQFIRLKFSAGTGIRPTLPLSCPTVSSRLIPSKASEEGEDAAPDDGDVWYELLHGLPAQRLTGSPVFVKLPVDAVSSAGLMKRRKAMAPSFWALATAGVEGVVMEVWWGLVERDAPRVYDWKAYLEIVSLAHKAGLKVRAVMAFHQYGTGPADPHWIPLPQWVREEMDKDPNLAYSDRFGRRNLEYISLGCDVLPVLRGRAPIQAYADFMRNFRDTFESFLGSIITGIQVGMGPAGELRYPSFPSHKLGWGWHSRELGEFMCYDKYMIASLNASACEIGMLEWGNGGPLGAGSLIQDPELTEFFRSDGSWNTSYGKFFLEWYSGMLLLHGEMICKEAETIFRDTEISISAKVAGINWHYGTRSHPSELTAGYYNTSIRDGYLPITRIFGRYGLALSCTCFEMQDAKEKTKSPIGSPEGLLEQLLIAARICNLPLEGENTGASLDDQSLQQVLKMSKLYSNGIEIPFFSFNFVRMDKNLFEIQNWLRFTRFVKQMSEVSSFRTKLNFGGDAGLSSSSGIGKVGSTFVYY